jgi:hypothetical protein
MDKFSFGERQFWHRMAPKNGYTPIVPIKGGRRIGSLRAAGRLISSAGANVRKSRVEPLAGVERRSMVSTSRTAAGGGLRGHSHQIFARAKWLFLRRGQQQRENSENYDQQSNRRKFAMILRTAT